MRLRLLGLGLALCFLTSCAVEAPPQLPELFPPSEPVVRADHRELCQLPFPGGQWQFVHSISFTMVNGGGTTLIGVTVLEENELHTALMTIEGLTLFAARFSGSLEVRRAVPPFDKPAFAAGLMNDVRAIFVGPTVPDVQYGRLGDDQACCRMIADSGQVTDVWQPDGSCWQSITYSADALKTRDIVARKCRSVEEVKIPEELELRVPGPNGYNLMMTLMSVDRLGTASSDNKRP